MYFVQKSLFKKYKTNFSQNKNCIIQNSVNITKNTSERRINTNKIKFLILSRLLETKNIPFLIKTFKNDNFFLNINCILLEMETKKQNNQNV